MVNKRTVERCLVISIVAGIAFAAVWALSFGQEVHAAPLDLYAENLRCVDTSPDNTFRMSVRGTIYYVQSGTGVHVGEYPATVWLTANGITRHGDTFVVPTNGGFDIDVPAGFVSTITISVTTPYGDNYVSPTSWNCIPLGYGCDTGGSQGVVADAVCTAPSVGGIGELTDVKAVPEQSAPSSNNFAPFAIGGASAAALVAVGALWVLRRRKATR